MENTPPFPLLGGFRTSKHCYSHNTHTPLSQLPSLWKKRGKWNCQNNNKLQLQKLGKFCRFCGSLSCRAYNTGIREKHVRHTSPSANWAFHFSQISSVYIQRPFSLHPALVVGSQSSSPNKRTIKSWNSKTQVSLSNLSSCRIFCTGSSRVEGGNPGLFISTLGKKRGGERNLPSKDSNTTWA